MLAYGTFSGIFKSDLKTTIKKIKEYGLNCVQLDLSFPDLDLEYNETLAEKLTIEKCHRIRDAFREANLPIVGVSGYANFLTPDPAVRKMSITRTKALLKCARELGTPYVISEAGGLSSFNDDNWIWDWKAENELPEVFDEIVEIIRAFAVYAYDYGSVFLLEPYKNGTIGSVDQVAETFARINHPGLALLFDPCNFFNEENVDDMDNEINRMFNTFGDKARIAHAKDVKHFDPAEKVNPSELIPARTFRSRYTEPPVAAKGGKVLELPHAGQGIFNYELFLKRLVEMHPNIPIILEHFSSPNQIPFAMNYVTNILKKVGG